MRVLVLGGDSADDGQQADHHRGKLQRVGDRKRAVEDLEREVANFAGCGDVQLCASRDLARNRPAHLVEIGPGRVLSGLAKRIAPELRLLNVQDQASLSSTVEALAA